MSAGDVTLQVFLDDFSVRGVYLAGYDISPSPVRPCMWPDNAATVAIRCGRQS